MIDPSHDVEWWNVEDAPPLDGLTDRAQFGACGTGMGCLIPGMTQAQADRFGVELVRGALLLVDPVGADQPPIEFPAQVKTRPMSRPFDPCIYWRVTAGPQEWAAGDECDHVQIPLERLQRPVEW